MSCCYSCYLYLPYSQRWKLPCHVEECTGGWCVHLPVSDTESVVCTWIYYKPMTSATSELRLPNLPSQPRSIATARWPVLVLPLMVVGWVVYVQTVHIFSTNWAQYRASSLMCTTPLLLSQTAIVLLYGHLQCAPLIGRNSKGSHMVFIITGWPTVVQHWSLALCIMLTCLLCSIAVTKKARKSFASRLAESEHYCHSGIFVCLSFRDLQPTTIDRSQPNLVCWYIPVLAPV